MNFLKANCFKRALYTWDLRHSSQFNPRQLTNSILLLLTLYALTSSSLHHFVLLSVSVVWLIIDHRGQSVVTADRWWSNIVSTVSLIVDPVKLKTLEGPSRYHQISRGSSFYLFGDLENKKALILASSAVTTPVTTAVPALSHPDQTKRSNQAPSTTTDLYLKDNLTPQALLSVSCHQIEWSHISSYQLRSRLISSQPDQPYIKPILRLLEKGKIYISISER